jgi:hypothetical protein
LLSYDQTFVLPLCLMSLTYQLVRHSEHPFLINLRTRWHPVSLGLLVIYSTCLTIVLPQTYLISYMAFVSSHIAVRGLGKWLRLRQERIRMIQIFKF